MVNSLVFLAPVGGATPCVWVSPHVPAPLGTGLDGPCSDARPAVPEMCLLFAVQVPLLVRRRQAGLQVLGGSIPGGFRFCCHNSTRVGPFAPPGWGNSDHYFPYYTGIHVVSAYTIKD
jgi:hypothetical protein